VVKAIWLISAFFAVVIFSAANDRESGLPMWFELRQERVESGKRIALLRSEVEKLQVEVEALKSDSVATERAIREVLEFAQPGETVVRFVDQGEGPTARLN
jgi:cell division protein FtsB